MARFRIRKVPSKRLWRVYEDSRIISVHRSRSAAEDKLVRLERSRPKRRKKRADFDSEKLVKLVDKQVDKLSNQLQRTIQNANLNDFDIEEGRKLETPENNIPAVKNILYKKAKAEKDSLTQAAIYLTLNSLENLKLSDAPVPDVEKMNREYQAIVEGVIEKAKRHIQDLVLKTRRSRKVDTSKMTWAEMKDLANVAKNQIDVAAENFDKATIYAVVAHWISELAGEREELGDIPIGRERDREVRKLTRSIRTTIQEYMALLKREGIIKV